MATCRKLTIQELIAAREREVGKKLTKEEKLGVELAPTQYTCTGNGVGALRGKKIKARARRAAR